MLLSYLALYVLNSTMIYIVGTSHSTQMWSDAVGDWTALEASATMVANFEEFLSDTATALGAVAIAEELSEEVVARRVGGSSAAKAVCDRLGIKHAYCDPDTAERKRLGIANDDWTVREAYWWSTIQRRWMLGGTLLFVCGANHVDSFSALLERSGASARIYCPDWTLL